MQVIIVTERGGIRLEIAPIPTGPEEGSVSV